MLYFMAELVSHSLEKIAHADWLLNGPICYDIGPICFLFRTGNFWREKRQADFDE